MFGMVMGEGAEREEDEVADEIDEKEDKEQ